MEAIMSISLLFGLVIFFILDLIALVFDIFVITGPLGVFVSFLSTLAYILFTFMVYGKIKGTSKLFDFKKNFKQKAFKTIGKKAFKLIGGSTVPFVNVWAVWDDYKQEKKALDEKKAIIGEETEEQVAKNKIEEQQVEQYQKAEAERLQEEDREESLDFKERQKEAENIKEEENINPWISRDKSRDIKSKDKKKSIQEEVGGIKTGMNREDYDEGITDYSKKETYDKMVKDKKEKDEAESRKMKDVAVAKSVSDKMKQVEDKNAYDKEFIRRFGLDAFSRMKRDREIREGSEKKKSENSEVG